jgi:hypothetical protein
MFKFKKTKVVLALLSILGLVFWQAGPFFSAVLAANLTSGSVSLSDSRPSETGVTYTFDWSNVTTTTIKCIEIEFATTTEGGTAPADLSLASVSANSSSTYVSGLNTWTKGGSSGLVTFTNETGATGGSGTVVLDDVVNGSVAETGYYAIFNTYGNADCSTDLVDSGTVMFVYTDGQAVSMTVEPSLTFTVSAVGVGETVNGVPTTAASTDGTIPLGTVTTETNAVVAHDLSVGTNGAGGYTVHIRYTGALAFGSEEITDHTGANADPTDFPGAGVEAFGYTTDSEFSSNKWAGFTTSNESVATAASGPASENFMVGYQAGISSTTASGNYTTTVILTATPTY